MSDTAVPVAEGLFTWPSDTPTLLGSRCADCAMITFPAHRGCPRCGSTAMEPMELATRGELWTWTSQEFRPPSPPYTGAEEFTPHHIGYVLLPGELHVETLLTGFDDRPPRIGEEVELTVIPFAPDADGNPRVTYAFRPATSEPA